MNNNNTSPKKSNLKKRKKDTSIKESSIKETPKVTFVDKLQAIRAHGYATKTGVEFLHNTKMQDKEILQALGLKDDIEEFDEEQVMKDYIKTKVVGSKTNQDLLREYLVETESLPLKKGDIFEDPFESEKNPPFTPALPLDYEESQEKKEESEDELIEILEDLKVLVLIPTEEARDIYLTSLGAH